MTSETELRHRLRTSLDQIATDRPWLVHEVQVALERGHRARTAWTKAGEAAAVAVAVGFVVLGLIFAPTLLIRHTTSPQHTRRAAEEARYVNVVAADTQRFQAATHDFDAACVTPADSQCYAALDAFDAAANDFLTDLDSVTPPQRFARNDVALRADLHAFLGESARFRAAYTANDTSQLFVAGAQIGDYHDQVVNDAANITEAASG